MRALVIIMPLTPLLIATAVALVERWSKRSKTPPQRPHHFFTEECTVCGRNKYDVLAGRYSDSSCPGSITQ